MDMQELMRLWQERLENNATFSKIMAQDTGIQIVFNDANGQPIAFPIANVEAEDLTAPE